MSKTERDRRYRQRKKAGGGVDSTKVEESTPVDSTKVVPSPLQPLAKSARQVLDEIADKSRDNAPRPAAPPTRDWVHPRDRPPRRRLYWPLPPEGFCNHDGYGADGEYRPMLPTWTQDPPLPDDPTRDQFSSIRAFYQQQRRR